MASPSATATTPAAATMDRRVLVVASKGGAPFKTVSDAVKAAVEGDTVLLRMGTYDEKVVVDKSIDVVGEENADAADIVINGGLVATAGGCLRHLSIQQALEIRSGAVRVEDVDVSLGCDGIVVQAGADPTIIKCRIHHAQSGGDGIYFAEGAKGTVEDCEIHHNRVNGIHVNGADVAIRRTKVNNSPYGVYFRKGGRGSVENCYIEQISCFGVYIVSGSAPAVIKNNVLNCGVHAVMVSQQGAGNLRDNTIHGSVRILRGCAPVIGVNTLVGRMDNENVAPLPPPA